MKAPLAVVHLVWAPLGVTPLRAFLSSYQAHDAGTPHELVFVINGLDVAPGARDTLLTELRGTERPIIELERAVLDLTAYGLAARALEHRRLCFLNSYSQILADGWLAGLSHAIDTPGVGVAGATASWESQAEWMRGAVRFWPYQLVRRFLSADDFPRFPNPHVRTTGFIMDRDAVLDRQLDAATDKRSTYLLESGHASITREILEHGGRAVVVGRDGRHYDVEEWPESHTFRSGMQENLLIADNRTAEWLGASSKLQRQLARDAWGASRFVSAPAS